METKTYTVYKFKELSEESQEKAIENLSDINVDYNWWEYTYKDAEEIGLKITSFEIDRYCEGKFIFYVKDVISAIRKNHGKKCETYKTAMEYNKEFLKSSEKFDDEEIKHNFLNSLLEDYRIMLGKEVDYLCSKEAIIETIECNDYDFTEDGKLD